MNRAVIIPPGATPPHEHDIDQTITDAIALALGERKVRFTDRRLMVLYLVTVALLSFFLWQQHANFVDFRKASVTNCRREQFIVDKANAYYEAQIRTTRARTDLKPADRNALLRNFAAAEFPSLNCDDLPGA